jgi:tetratricopeptide (TPR) repeat protein
LESQPAETPSTGPEVEAVIQSPEERQAAEAARERARAEKLWRRLQAAGDRQAWRDLIVNDPEFHSFALCEKLCHESAELAEDDAEGAFELASLALELAPKVTGEEKLRCGIQEYAWMHLGNGFRARGDLRKAEEAFSRAEELFFESMRGTLPSLILRDRLAGLEAALLRDQGNLPEALRKISHALSLAGDRGASRPALLLEEGRLRRRLGQPEAALEALSWADRVVQSSELRLSVRIKLELGAALCDLGRHGEAKKLIGSIPKAAGSFPLERARLRCLQGRVAAGLGRLGEAQAALQKGHADLHERVVTDLALLALEIAALYARQGQTEELKSLAEQTLRLAESPGLGREAAATLKLWNRLAAQEKLSFERALQFVRDFSRVPDRRPQ